MLHDEVNQIVRFASGSEEDLALSVDGVFLQIDGNGFCHAEVFHRFGNNNA